MNNSARALQDLLQRQRDYAVAAHMIQSLNVRSIRLMTNNPAKVQQLQGYGVQVHGRIPTSSLPTITIASTWSIRISFR